MFTTASGAQVMNNEPMTGGYAHGGEVRHIAQDFGAKFSICGKELQYTIQMSSLDIATCRSCRKWAKVR